MSLPPLQMQPISTSHYYTSGDVTIAPGVAIAPGVLLQADPDSRIIIQAGACIGIGAILHASQGTVEVGERANIGAEVLLIGHVIIGANACIGAATTIFNRSVERGQIIPPGSLLGDSGRRGEELQATDTVVYPAAEASSNGHSPPREAQSAEVESSHLVKPVTSSGVNVYGQVYVNQLLVKMFPNSQRVNSSPIQPEKLSLTEDPWDD